VEDQNLGNRKKVGDLVFLRLLVAGLEEYCECLVSLFYPQLS